MKKHFSFGIDCQDVILDILVIMLNFSFANISAPCNSEVLKDQVSNRALKRIQMLDQVRVIPNKNLKRLTFSSKNKDIYFLKTGIAEVQRAFGSGEERSHGCVGQKQRGCRAEQEWESGLAESGDAAAAHH